MNISHLLNNKRAVWGMLALVAMLPILSTAGTGGTEFDAVNQLLVDWTQGSLGRVVAGAMILVGMIAGVARQSLMAFAVGIGGGVGLFYAPDVINGVMTAALPIL